jgi:hypothetical protein
MELEPISIAIAGTAGRRDDGAKLSRELYDAMEEATGRLVQEVAQGRPITLVSGGAAYADHLAVRLFLKGLGQKLVLHLPCPWDVNTHALRDTKVFDWKSNPGGTANALHRKFEQKTNVFSMRELAAAIANPQCETTVSAGFHARNALMAKSEVLVALTFGEGAEVKDGGTANTCQTYLSRIAKEGKPDLSWHIDLNQLPLTPVPQIKLPTPAAQKTRTWLPSNPRQ